MKQLSTHKVQVLSAFGARLMHHKPGHKVYALYFSHLDCNTSNKNDKPPLIGEDVNQWKAAWMT